jgi:hypothetical protein
MDLLMSSDAATKFERKGQPPGNDRAESDRIDRWLFRVHASILAIAAALYVAQGQRDWWPMAVVGACYTPYFIVRVRPSILMFAQAMLWCYLTQHMVINGAEHLGTTAVITAIQVFLTVGVMTTKRVWYGLDAQYC